MTIHVLELMLQLLNSLFWVSQDILMGGDESPPIRISRDTQNKLFNKELVSRLPKVTCITTHQHREYFRRWSVPVPVEITIIIYLIFDGSSAYKRYRSLSVCLSVSLSLSPYSSSLCVCLYFSSLSLSLYFFFKLSVFLFPSLIVY